MNAMRPDQIVEEMDRQRQNDLRDFILIVVMLIIISAVSIGMILLDILS